MKLIRNTTSDGRCKYALVRLDKLRKFPRGSFMTEEAAKALDSLASIGLLEYGEKGSVEEFFTVKLKDIAAPAALLAYSKAIVTVDAELAKDVEQLAKRAMERLDCKRPD